MRGWSNEHIQKIFPGTSSTDGSIDPCIPIWYWMHWNKRLAEADMDASVGSVGDSCDNSLAEIINSLYKTEVIRCGGLWKILKRLNMQPWNGWTGLSITVYLNRLTMCRQPNVK